MSASRYERRGSYAMALVAVRQFAASTSQPRRQRRVHAAEAPPVLSPKVFPGSVPVAGDDSGFLSVRTVCGEVLLAPVAILGFAYDCQVCRRILEEGVPA